jgi:hypothetical protein
LRVAFFEPTADSLSNHRKGELFERLTRRIVEASGYTNVFLRRKHNSLEYDVEGRSALHGISLIGEAKALEKKIEGQVISAFVGKLLPLAHEERIDGLFVSVSPFTAEAADYLSSLEGALSGQNISLTTLVGDQIPAFLRDRLGQASEDVLRERVRATHGLHGFDVWLVVTERDEFFVLTCGPNLERRRRTSLCSGPTEAN